MRAVGGTIDLSASDLSRFLGCRHLTALDMQMALGQRERPTWVDPILEVLQKRGLDHEKGYVASLRIRGQRELDLSDLNGDEAVTATAEALRRGVAVIVQPALREGRWFGRPDLLRRVEKPSKLGAWSYEVVDTKLARETQGGTVLQLGLYSDLLSAVQGKPPETFHVVTPDPEARVQSFRVQDYSAYFRLVRRRLEATTEQDPAEVAATNYPEPVEQCDICRWWGHCDKRRRKDDHLSLVAGISRLQSRELERRDVTTLAKLASIPLPLSFRPDRGAIESYERIHEQARVQLEGRKKGKPVHELLPVVENHGLTRLPAPSVGDVFLDLEGDSFAREGGREYLFGLLTLEAGGLQTYTGHWAYTDLEENAAFEAAVDFVLERWARDQAMHVYHYGHYETSAFKRLMGRYATRETEIDRMLRAGLFVDLHSVVKHSLRASVEKYSIKDLEQFYGFKRAVDLKVAGTNLRLVERALELDDTASLNAEIRAAVERYNRDDCVSTWHLRDWLEELRASVETGGTPVTRPTPKDAEAPEKVGDRERQTRELRDALIAGMPEDSERSPEQKAQWLLAHILDWHSQENKAPWWEFFRLCGLSDEELLDERAALAGLRLVRRVGGTARSPVDRYSYPAQETDVHDGDKLRLPDESNFGSVEAIDRKNRTVDIKKPGVRAEHHPTAIFSHDVIRAEVLSDALLRLAQDVLDQGITGGNDYRAERDLLLGRPPRLREGAFLLGKGEKATDFAQRVVVDLDETVLPIQGPPGSGKTHTGAQLICELVRRGTKVGVMAVSHKVIRKLLDEVVAAAQGSGVAVSCVQKVTENAEVPSLVEELTDSDEPLARLADSRANVVGGTAWFWARPGAKHCVDVLFIDEAGQMSLATALAAFQGAKNVVLLGDPQQLEQPQQGSHPEGTGVSVLEHVLGDHQTMPPDRGILLPETWRLAPAICAFTSEVFYEGKLGPRPGLEQQLLASVAPFDGAGLWVVPVEHEGNQSSSAEEVEAVDRIAGLLLRGGARWVDKEGAAHGLAGKDILVVAPYNAQVDLLAELLDPRGIRVGTVDRFQGQQAPVVIYSMTTSTPEEAPHGMEFLYSLNRLNVATSRAQCASILVASPRLFEPECRTPRQMRLANALCRYVELARAVDLS